MNWDLFWLIVTIAAVTASLYFSGMAIYTLGKLHGLREARKMWEQHFGR